MRLTGPAFASAGRRGRGHVLQGGGARRPAHGHTQLPRPFHRRCPSTRPSLSRELINAVGVQAVTSPGFGFMPTDCIVPVESARVATVSAYLRVAASDGGWAWLGTLRAESGHGKLFRGVLGTDLMQRGHGLLAACHHQSPTGPVSSPHSQPVLTCAACACRSTTWQARVAAVKNESCGSCRETAFSPDPADWYYNISGFQCVSCSPNVT